MITTELKKPQLYQCSECGADTEWEWELGSSPLCVDCWDKTASSYYSDKVAAAKKAYREKNPDKVAAVNKAWYEANKDKVYAG